MDLIESTPTVFVDVGEAFSEDNITANVDSQDVKIEIRDDAQNISQLDIKSDVSSFIPTQPIIKTLSDEDNVYWTKWLWQNKRAGKGEDLLKLRDGTEKPKGKEIEEIKHLGKQGEDFLIQRNEYELEIASTFSEHKEKPDVGEVVMADIERRKDVEAKVQKQIASKGSGILHTVTCKICKKKCFTRGSSGSSARFKSHVEGHFEIRSPCPYCEAVFTLTRFLELHKEMMHFKDNAAEREARRSFVEQTRRRKGGRKSSTENKEKVSLEQILVETLGKKKEVESKVSELRIKDGNQMFCGVCNLSFDRKGRNVSQRFKSHVEGHLDLKHPCPYCSLVCTRTNNLRLHKKKSHLSEYKLEKNYIQLKMVGILPGKGNIFCKICDTKFVTKNSLEAHTRKQHQGGEDTAIAQKKVSFSEIKALISAQLERKGSRENEIFSCRMCSFSQPKRIDNVIVKMRQHIESHLKVQVSCTNCEKSFKAIRLMKIHRRNDHSMIEIDTKVESITELEAERRVREQFQKISKGDDKTFKCTVCDFKTINKNCNARREMKVHTEKHLNVHISCTFCEKVFPSCRMVKMHKRRNHASEHENEKMLQSVEAKKVKESNLSKQSLPEKKISGGHKQDKPASSNLKNIETTVGNTLKNEEISEKIEANMTVDKDNSGKKKYVCKICWESGHQRTPMLLHVELHLGMALPCPQCDSVERTRSNLKLHMFNAHNN